VRWLAARVMMSVRNGPDTQVAVASSSGTPMMHNQMPTIKAEMIEASVPMSSTPRVARPAALKLSTKPTRVRLVTSQT
jgi:hypothetical protein